VSLFNPSPPAGRTDPLPDIPSTHEVLDTPLHGPWGEHAEVMYVAMGCFWGAERLFWTEPGVFTTAVGYMGGSTPNPTYREVCSGRTGHTEAVQVVYDRSKVRPEDLLKVFWENHDPTTRDRQGNDRGTQYRSAIYWTTQEQEEAARASTEAFQGVLHEHGHGTITTELTSASTAGDFYFAEGYHQQYLHKNPGGYCNHGPNGMTCPVGVVRQDQLPAQQSVIDPRD
jgi:peptide-methionine (S)-S-oxide reductase